MSFHRTVLWIAIILIPFSGSALADDGRPVRYDGHKVVRVEVGSVQQIDQIHALGALLLSDAEGIGPVDYLFPPEAMSGLEALGLPYRVLNEDIQKDIDAERERLARAVPVDPRDRGWFEDYKNNDQINQFLDALVAQYPNMVRKDVIGTSIEGRTMYAIRVSGPTGDPDQKTGLCFNATQHAREWITPMTVLYIMDRLLREYATDPQVRFLLDRLTFYVAPVSNPDGYVYCWDYDRMWRKNRRVNAGSSCRGVDLNRNWSVGWGGSGSSSNPCSETYRGTAPFSEPETQALRDYILAHPNIVAHIDVHSYSQLIMWPYGYDYIQPPEPDLGVLRELATDMAAAIYATHGQSYTPQPAYQLYLASGICTDWVYDIADAFSWTFELRDTGQYGFLLPPEQIIPTGEEIYAAVRVLAEFFTLLLKFEFPNGLPAFLVPDTPQDVLVRITEIGGTLDPGSPRLHARIGDYGPFTETSLTPLGGNQYQATLPPVPCGRTLQYYFSAKTTDNQMVFSPPDAPESVYEVEAWPVVVVLDVNMDTNPGWSTQAQWAWGRPTGGGGQYGGPDPTSGHTGLNVYGYNLNGDYTNNMPEYHLTTQAIDCTGLEQVHLRFWRWLGVERSTYDHAYIRISTNGVNWTNIWQNPDSEIADRNWVFQEFDISAHASNQPTVYLRWTMGTTDSGWTYCGWNIDDVQVWALDPGGCPGLVGDVNCDGVVDFGDINPFVLALANLPAYLQQYPDCPFENRDINGDGRFDFADINPFVWLLTGP